MNVKVIGKRIGVLCLCAIVLMVSLFTGAPKVEAASKSAYLIKVNKRCNTVTVYKKDRKGKYTKPVKAFVCSTGSATPVGTFHTQAKYRWKILNHNVWGQYSTRITGSILFHSVWYYQKDPSTLSITQYNRLGTTASAGCVRLTTEDAKWIYDNCGLGTTVQIYNSNNPGPLGKPSAMKISKYSWDPTDVWSKQNPWNKKGPSITGTKNQTVYVGTKPNFAAGVKSYDTCGNKITSELKIDTSKLNMKKAGTYNVYYSVKDKLGRTAKQTIKVTVKDPDPVVIKGVKDRVYRYDTYKNKKITSYAMNGVSAKAGKKKLNSKQFTCSAKVVKNDKSALVYKVTYTAKNPVNGSKTKKTAKITLDKQAPTISCDKQYMTTDEFNQFKQQLKAKKYTKVSMKDNITAANKLAVETKIKDLGHYEYDVTYKVKDQVGNTATKTQRIYVLNKPELKVKEAKVMVKSEKEIEAHAKSNVKLIASGKDFTWKYKNSIQYKVNAIEKDASYEVVYTLKLGGKTFTAKATYIVEK